MTPNELRDDCKAAILKVRAEGVTVGPQHFGNFKIQNGRVLWLSANKICCALGAMVLVNPPPIEGEATSKEAVEVLVKNLGIDGPDSTTFMRGFDQGGRHMCHTWAWYYAGMEVAQWLETTRG